MLANLAACRALGCEFCDISGGTVREWKLLKEMTMTQHYYALDRLLSSERGGNVRL